MPRRIAAEERVADRYRRAASPELAPQAMEPTEFVPTKRRRPKRLTTNRQRLAGQGFPIDVESKLATKERAMSIAMAHYAIRELSSVSTATDQSRGTSSAPQRTE